MRILIIDDEYCETTVVTETGSRSNTKGLIDYLASPHTERHVVKEVTFENIESLVNGWFNVLTNSLPDNKFRETFEKVWELSI